MIVVDTTVLTEVFVHSSPSGSVDALRAAHPQWVVPDLWRHELICVMWKYIRAGKGSVAGSREAMHHADQIMGPSTYRVSSASVLTAALEFGISTYDAHFVALARELNTTLYTHDRALIKKCPKIAKHPEDVD